MGVKRVLRWRDDRFTIWTPAQTGRLGSAWAAGSLYVFSPEAGLLRLEDGEFKPASDDPALRRVAIRALLAEADGTLFIGTKDDGAFVLRSGALSPWMADGNALLKAKGVFRMLRLRDGSLAVASNAAGLLLFDRTGRFRTRVDNAAGVRGGNLLSLFEDAEDGLWVGLRSGIVRAEVSAPWSILRAGPQDDVADVFSIDEWLGTLVLDNRAGLYRYVPPDPTAPAGAGLERLPVEATDFVNVCGVKNGLLAIRQGGIFLLDAKGRLEPVTDDNARAQEMWVKPGHPERVLFTDDRGRVNELSLDPATDRWQAAGVLVDTGKTTNLNMVPAAQDGFWLGSQENGLFHLRFLHSGEGC